MLSFLKNFYRGWMRFGKRMAVFQTKLLMFTSFYLFVVPFSFVVRVFVKQPSPGWHRARDRCSDMDEARKQF